MNKRTLEALQGSIKKWDRIVKDARAMDRGKNNCPLCEEFWGNSCRGCPVAKKTGVTSCNKTPYAAWGTHLIDDHRQFSPHHRVPGCKTCMKWAKAERDFLIGLLPKPRGGDA